MSKAFTRDDAREEPVVAPRPPLPDGVPNYVTPRGLRLLREELVRLERQARELDEEGGDEEDVRQRRAVLAQRMSELGARIASAQLVDHAGREPGTVRFGALVTVRTLDPESELRHVQIVGVDEADPAQGRIAFTAPLARAVMGLAAGDGAVLETPAGDEEIEVVAVDYPADPP